jgi:hypothetical protein
MDGAVRKRETSYYVPYAHKGDSRLALSFKPAVDLSLLP